MIIYKPKNTPKNRFPYANLLLMLVLVGGLLALALYSTPAVDETANVNAAPPVINNVEVPNLSGEWVGMMSEDYGVDRHYDFRIVFTQDDNSARGMMYQDASNIKPEIYAESILIGTVEGDTFSFYEARVMQLENLTLDHWCRIEATLKYEKIGDQDTLVGTWDSVEHDRYGCTTIDGRIMLTRNN